jgi:plasmid stabilization system protein ParE
MMIYDANIKIIKQEIDLSDNPNRALRHAYKDLVSTFEFYCKNTAKKLELGNINFQEIKGTRKFFRKSKYKIDIYSDITERGKIDVKRVFQKRHAYEHHNGEISERYIKELPEDRNLLGQKADLSYSEFENGAKIVRKMLQPIVDLISKNIK